MSSYSQTLNHEDQKSGVRNQTPSKNNNLFVASSPVLIFAVTGRDTKKHSWKISIVRGFTGLTVMDNKIDITYRLPASVFGLNLRILKNVNILFAICSGSSSRRSILCYKIKYEYNNIKITLTTKFLASVTGMVSNGKCIMLCYHMNFFYFCYLNITLPED